MSDLPHFSMAVLIMSNNSEFGTNSPRAIICFVGDSGGKLRKIAPTSMYLNPFCATKFFACVPLPAPWPPIKTIILFFAFSMFYPFVIFLMNFNINIKKSNKKLDFV